MVCRAAIFQPGLLVVMGLAQRLPVASIPEEVPVSTVRHDVVSIRCPDSEPMLIAFPAERLPDQLVGAAFRPVISGIRVQVMPGSGLFAGDLGFVGWTPALAGNHPAPWVLAFA